MNKIDGSKYIPYNEREGSESIVYFTRDLSSEGLKKVYERVNSNLKGKIAIKLHTGEKHGPNIIPRVWVKDLINSDIKGGTIVETNTYYEGDRYTTKDHLETLKVNGWTFAPVDIMDAEGTTDLPVKGGKHFDHMTMGKDILNYDFYRRENIYVFSDKFDFDDVFFRMEDDSKDSFTMVLKKDQHIPFDIEIDGKPIKVDLRYNTVFNKGKNKFKTYSVMLKPDYSLIIYIDDKKHILHFDAKYKLNIYDESFKNEDVVKMHAYKDAIADTIGAYVLYPGEKKELYHEDEMRLKSVGAFPLNPGENKDKEELLRDFIIEMIEKLVGN